MTDAEKAAKLKEVITCKPRPYNDGDRYVFTITLGEFVIIFRNLLEGGRR